MPLPPKKIQEPLVLNLIESSRSNRPKKKAYLPDISQPDASAASITRQAKLDSQIQLLPSVSRDLAASSNITTENHIGFVSVPVGLAGPLTINGTYQTRKTLYAPLATVEPTVVAACSRGCKVFSACGGVSASSLDTGLSRGPAFTFSTIPQALAFYKLVPSLFGYLKNVADSTSRHGTLISVEPHIIGTSVHVEFMYKCGDAAGQNMVALATHAACSALMSEDRPDGLVDFQIEANFSSDKKSAWGSVLEPRGVSVLAWGKVSNDVSQKMLGCSTRRLKAVLSRFEEGGVRHGQLGQCLSTSNIVAAMFISCGQDVGSVPESGFSHLTGEYDHDTEELTLSLFFPSLLVGSVGGATGYTTQKEALEFIGCYGDGKKWALAETIAAFALALELSSLGAFATDTFAASHKDLARGPKSKL